MHTLSRSLSQFAFFKFESVLLASSTCTLAVYGHHDYLSFPKLRSASPVAGEVAWGGWPLRHHAGVPRAQRRQRSPVLGITAPRAEATLFEEKERKK